MKNTILSFFILCLLGFIAGCKPADLMTMGPYEVFHTHLPLWAIEDDHGNLLKEFSEPSRFDCFAAQHLKTRAKILIEPKNILDEPTEDQNEKIERFSGVAELEFHSTAHLFEVEIERKTQIKTGFIKFIVTSTRNKKHSLRLQATNSQMEIFFYKDLNFQQLAGYAYSSIESQSTSPAFSELCETLTEMSQTAQIAIE